MRRRDFLKLGLAGLEAWMIHPFFELSAYAKERLGGKQVSRHTKKFLKGVFVNFARLDAGSSVFWKATSWPRSEETRYIRTAEESYVQEAWPGLIWLTIRSASLLP